MPRPRPERPGPGQESVWDYPRPPRVETVDALVEVDLGGRTVAATRQALRVLETSHPPTYYLPRDAFADGVLRDAEGASWCEWKGRAAYVDLVTEQRVARRAAWHYPDPAQPYEHLRDHLAVYPGLVDQCRVDGEVVQPQPGGFYGGWVTAAVVGPFKGGPGSQGW